jgi:hypothetical protein
VARKRDRSCTKCGQPMWGGKRCLPPGQGTCRKCRDEMKPLRVRKDGMPYGSGPQTFTCQRCARHWQREPVRGQVPKWCPDCKHMGPWERRRAALLGAFVEDVDRTAVFLADGYRCHLCGKMTDKSKGSKHPLAPTIDHVIPLSVGGKHERSNCRTAHFSCNSAKRNRGGGEQMLLLAV